MPVTIYIGRDIQNKTKLPDKSHEARGVRRVCRSLWDNWHHDSARHYAIIAGPNQTPSGFELSADMVVISELGLGVVELKEVYGRIICQGREEPWLVGSKSVGSGSAGYENPHRQVQDYASHIRRELIDDNWLPGQPEDWEFKYKFHTAVCFTHADAEIEACRELIQQSSWQDENLLHWELFTILRPEEIRGWATDLRFETNMGPAHGFEQPAWTPATIEMLATDFFNARPWREITGQMPPYGYLTITSGGMFTERVFPLDREQVIVGRALECDIQIPERYASVSRRHVVINRTFDGVTVTDEGSKNGTVAGDQRLEAGGSYLLQDGNEILLGGTRASENVCVLKFTLQKPTVSETRTWGTEAGPPTV